MDSYLYEDELIEILKSYQKQYPTKIAVDGFYDNPLVFERKY